MSYRSWGAMALLGFALIALSGCEGGDGDPTKLKVGTVDIMRVLEERPETMDIKLDWASQAGATYMQLSEVHDKAEAAAVKSEIDRRAQAWQKRMDEFMEESIVLVEREAAVLAQERGLDLVLVDNPLTKTIRYREGEDLTLDISLKLQDQ